MKTFLRVTFLFICILTLAAFSLLIYLFVSTSNIELDTTKFIANSLSVSFYDCNYELIEDQNTSTKKYVNINEIPKHTKNSFIAIEDKRFYKHNGIDYKRMLKAGIKNISKLSYAEGASTISQQLIKNTHLTNKKSLKRKFAEIKLTRQLEKKFSKEDIIELYLNTIYFGENAFGISNAARLYFNKTINDLNIAESAMLAGIIKAPSKYNPIKNQEKCAERRNIVLSVMKQQQIIKNEEYNAEKNKPLPDKKHGKTSSYLNEAYNELVEITSISPYVLADGCKVITYMDSNYQTALEKIELLELKAHNTSGILIDNKSGAIKAYRSDIGNIMRQPGSLIKPLLVYAPAIENDIITPATLIEDCPTSFGDYTPKNYKDIYNNYISCRYALAHSLNVPAVKIYSYLKAANAPKYLPQLNINLTNEDDTLSAALGGLTYGCKFIDIVGAYNTFANRGLFSSPVFINEVIDKNGNTIYKHQIKQSKVFSESTAFMMNDMLKNTVKEGTAKNLRYLDFDIAAKTGTCGDSNGNTDAYSVCYTSEYTLGFWAGCKDKELMDNKITGGTYPTIANKTMLSKIYENHNPENFFTSNEIVTAALDKIDYEQNKTLTLADENAPEKYTLFDYFKKSKTPKHKSSRFSVPIIEDADIKVQDNDVCIVLCLAEYYEYEIYKEFDGINSLIYDSLNKERTLVFKEKLDKIGKYKYTIVPYVVINDKKISGKIYDLPEIKISTINAKNKDDRDNKIIEEDNWWRNDIKNIYNFI